MSKQNNSKTSSNKGVFATLGGWMRRLWRGGSNDLANQMEAKAADAATAADVEEIISPARQILNNFLERKLAVGALIVLILMFITMFVGPLFMPKYYDAYTEVTQKSIPPTMSMMSVPSQLKKEGIKEIDGFGSFTVGLSNEGNVFVWGSSKIGTTGIDVADIPEEVKNSKVEMVAAGIDHVVAVTDEGKVICWGNNQLGQYGTETEVLERGGELNPNIAYEPEILSAGIDVTRIKKLTAGYQCTAIILDDGTLYLWGNKNAYANMDLFLNLGTVYDMDFTLNYIVGVNGKRNTIYTGSRGLYDVVRPNVDGKAYPAKQYIGKRKVEEIVATSSSMALLLNDGSVCFAGDFPAGMQPAPVLPEGEKFVDIVGGSAHYSGLTDKGNVYSWGSNQLNQTEVPKKLSNVSDIYSGSFQTYAVGSEGQLLGKWGLKGYVFGTDTHGADIFQRIINGGRMTMTIGAVAVIISSIIGIAIGCLSGYFGGKLDIFLMRVAEIFSAIPFLPFAMILSAVMGRSTLTETMRIFIIMCILGILTWPGLARLVRGQVLVARESEYVTAAKAMGVKESTIAFKHILPNVMSVILVTLMLDFGTCMLTESSLSYLGFGVAYPRPTWGNMLNGANNATIINTYWWQWLFTAIFLAVTTICINIVGDALRDVMDPKSSVEK